MPFQKGHKGYPKAPKTTVKAVKGEPTAPPIVEAIPPVAPTPQTPVVEAPTGATPVIDDYYDILVDYITTPSGNPIEAARVSRSDLYSAGVNIEALLQMGSIQFAGRMALEQN